MFFSACALVLTACGDDVPTSSVEEAASITLRDNGNSGGASDIEVNYDQFGLNQIERYRVYLVKSAQLVAHDLNFLQSLSADHYMDALPNEVIPTRGKMLPGGILDSDGDQVVEGVPYRAAVVSLPLASDDYLPSLGHSDVDLVLSQNNLVGSFTAQLESGAGALAIAPDGSMVLGSYNLGGELTTGSDPYAPLVYINPSGEAFSNESLFPFLGDVAYSNEGFFYASNPTHGEILTVQPGGEFQHFQLPITTIEKPDGLYVDGDNNLFIADRVSGIVTRIDPTGSASFVAHTRPGVRGLTGDDQGNLYASINQEDAEVMRISADGASKTLGKIPTFVPEDYRLPFIMWVGYLTYHDGSVYVAGTSTHKIYRVMESGELSVFAGTGEILLPYGDIKTAHFNRPMGLVVSADGKSMFVSGCEDIVPQHTQASAPSRVYRISLVE